MSENKTGIIKQNESKDLLAIEAEEITQRHMNQRVTRLPDLYDNQNFIDYMTKGELEETRSLLELLPTLNIYASKLRELDIFKADKEQFELNLKKFSIYLNIDTKFFDPTITNFSNIYLFLSAIDDYSSDAISSKQCLSLCLSVLTPTGPSNTSNRSKKYSDKRAGYDENGLNTESIAHYLDNIGINSKLKSGAETNSQSNFMNEIVSKIDSELTVERSKQLKKEIINGFISLNGDYENLFAGLEFQIIILDLTREELAEKFNIGGFANNYPKYDLQKREFDTSSRIMPSIFIPKDLDNDFLAENILIHETSHTMYEFGMKGFSFEIGRFINEGMTQYNSLRLALGKDTLTEDDVPDDLPYNLHVKLLIALELKWPRFFDFARFNQSTSGIISSDYVFFELSNRIGLENTSKLFLANSVQGKDLHSPREIYTTHFFDGSVDISSSDADEGNIALNLYYDQYSEAFPEYSFLKSLSNTVFSILSGDASPSLNDLLSSLRSITSDEFTEYISTELFNSIIYTIMANKYDDDRIRNLLDYIISNELEIGLRNLVRNTGFSLKYSYANVDIKLLNVLKRVSDIYLDMEESKLTAEIRELRTTLEEK